MGREGEYVVKSYLNIISSHFSYFTDIFWFFFQYNALLPGFYKREMYVIETEVDMVMTLLEH